MIAAATGNNEKEICQGEACGRKRESCKDSGEENKSERSRNSMSEKAVSAGMVKKWDEVNGVTAEEPAGSVTEEIGDAGAGPSIVETICVV